MFEPSELSPSPTIGYRVVSTQRAKPKEGLDTVLLLALATHIEGLDWLMDYPENHPPRNRAFYMGSCDMCIGGHAWRLFHQEFGLGVINQSDIDRVGHKLGLSRDQWMDLFYDCPTQHPGYSVRHTDVSPAMAAEAIRHLVETGIVRFLV